MKLFFDTETTGKANFKAEPWANGQPRLVQLAALLVNDKGEEVSHANLIIKPEGFEIPDEAAKIHGITTEMAYDCGVSLKAALSVFHYWWEASAMVICHNVSFDIFIMDGEFHRFFKTDKWQKHIQTFCTMRSMTDICQLPGKYGKYKWPKLQEAYKHAFGEEFDGAHDALADVRACARIYFWMMDQKKEVPA